MDRKMMVKAGKGILLIAMVALVVWIFAPPPVVPVKTPKFEKPWFDGFDLTPEIEKPAGVIYITDTPCPEWTWDIPCFMWGQGSDACCGEPPFPKGHYEIMALVMINGAGEIVTWRKWED